MNSIGWIYLFIAGFLEIGFTTSMKLMDGHKNIPWSIAFYVTVILSFGFFSFTNRVAVLTFSTSSPFPDSPEE